MTLKSVLLKSGRNAELPESRVRDPVLPLALASPRRILEASGSRESEFGRGALGDGGDLVGRLAGVAALGVGRGRGRGRGQLRPVRFRKFVDRIPVVGFVRIAAIVASDRICIRFQAVRVFLDVDGLGVVAADVVADAIAVVVVVVVALDNNNRLRLRLDFNICFQIFRIFLLQSFLLGSRQELLQKDLLLILASVGGRLFRSSDVVESILLRSAEKYFCFGRSFGLGAAKQPELALETFDHISKEIGFNGTKAKQKKDVFLKQRKEKKVFFGKKICQKRKLFKRKDSSWMKKSLVDVVVDESLAGLEEVVKDSMQMMSADHLIESRVVTTVYF